MYLGILKMNTFSSSGIFYHKLIYSHMSLGFYTFGIFSKYYIIGLLLKYGNFIAINSGIYIFSHICEWSEGFIFKLIIFYLMKSDSLLYKITSIIFLPLLSGPFGPAQSSFIFLFRKLIISL